MRLIACFGKRREHGDSGEINSGRAAKVIVVICESLINAARTRKYRSLGSRWEKNAAASM